MESQSPPPQNTEPAAPHRQNPIVVKKYANRRLYNTASSSYVTLESLAEMVREGLDFVVYDARTSEDLTRSVLTQIIVEQEGKSGQNLLPVNFLKQLIGFYGNSMQSIVPGYLDHAMKQFTENQEHIRDYYQKTFGNLFPFGNLGTIGEVGKQNMAMFERAMRFFTPFNFSGGFPAQENAPGPGGVNAKAEEAGSKSFSEMQSKLAALQAEVSELSRKK